MPARSEIQAEITAAQDKVRRKYLKGLANHTGTDTILYASAFTSKRIPNLPGYVLSVTIEDMQGFMAAVHGLKSPNLDLILHSPGGSLEAAEQIVNYLRAKFTKIRAFVPQNAMSAATMIA
jgi:ClpP class serine protease